MTNFNNCYILFGENYSCGGEQVIEILQRLAIIMPEVHWKAGDLDFVGSDSDFTRYKTMQAKSILSIDKFIKKINPDNQFLSGVILAFDEDDSNRNEIPIDTEEVSFLRFSSETLQVRFFDTSYVMIFTDDEKLLNFIEKLKLKHSISKKKVRPSNPNFYELIVQERDRRKNRK